MEENGVIDAVCRHLEGRGWVVEQRRQTSEHGIDVVAVQPASGARCLVEAKGGTSARPGTRRYNKPFTGSQIDVHVSRAVLTALQLRAEHPDAVTHEVLIAVPDDRAHRGRLEPIAHLLRAVALGALLVAADGSVQGL